MRNHRNVKVRMILVCIMEKLEDEKGSRKIETSETKVYFNTEIYINIEPTDVKVILSNDKRNCGKN